jgi:hypothetical protein
VTTTPTTPAQHDHRDRLLELRDLLTDQLKAGVPAAYLAPMARQLQLVLGELASMAEPAPNDPVAALRQRHRDRLQAAGVPDRPARKPRGHI